mmetsp:Transcript_1033/g.1877  ORF Transcript_1033/g.1877 Transcript_1033/m.1877 type:complete len:83 (+) Transcript_1033:251-499(+)
MPDETEINNNQFIMSNEVVGKYSFSDKNQKKHKLAPPPLYFTSEFIKQNFGQLPTQKEVILRGLEVPECGGLICTDQEALNK